MITIVATTVILLLPLSLCQIDITKLQRVGVLVNNPKGMKISQNFETRYLILSLIPKIENSQPCGDQQINQYKKLLDRLIIPLYDGLKLQKDVIVVRHESNNSTSSRKKRFFGEIIGTIAIGIATSAQITAAVALVEAKQARADIDKLKEAIRDTNKAVQSIQSSVGNLIVAVKSVQDYVNNEIVPSIARLGCEAAGLQLGIALTQHYSELTNIFGDNIGTLKEKGIKLQGIASLYRTNITEIFTTSTVDQYDIYDLLFTESIKMRVIDVDLNDYSITLQVRLPLLTKLSNTQIYRVDSISYNIQGKEWYIPLPNHIMTKGAFLGGADIKECIEAFSSYICPSDPGFILNREIENCLSGNITQCPKTVVTSDIVPRYAFVNGGVIANCIPTTCTCDGIDNRINQAPDQGIRVITHKECQVIGINGMLFRPNKEGTLATYTYDDIVLNNSVALDPIDISMELNKAKLELEESKEWIKKSNQKLDSVGGWYQSNITITIIIMMIIILFIINMIIIIIIFKQFKIRNRHPIDKSNEPYVLTRKQ
uniref:Fusion glycoprotein F0 n=1 Tax=Bovine parainfluenza 3 virus TaxID=3052729 RepID=A0A173DQM0_PI3B|nr:fusion protein [Respirovirus bovis]ANG56407.1 fusion protein [Respirovirus bovis]